MKTIFVASVVTLALFCAGCGNGNSSSGSDSAKNPLVPNASQYRALLEKRISSTDGANINIRQEMSRFESASEAEKLVLFNRASELAR